MKKRLMLGTMMIVLVCALVGGATFAYFSDTATNTGNTFTAGTLNMVMSDDNETDQDNLTATWVSPTNWAPGQEVTGTIAFKNTGSIKAQHIYFGFYNLLSNGQGDGTNLMDKIIVTNLTEKFNNTTVPNAVAAVEQQVGNKDGILTLRELAGFHTGADGYYTWDNKSGDGTLLAANSAISDYSLSFTFQFDPGAQNEYQRDTAGFTFKARATQNSPTDGLVCFHE